ncbi:CorA family divalent cation transporter [Paraburkholderia sp. JPY419]|uniref:CorA family divalent cation transporter n=1 Tax=Paraburkholderia sp. JPY419 TaxID=667660 RepID=UPI003D1C8EE7
MDADEVVDWFRASEDDADATAKDGGEFLWLHFNLAHSASERWMRTQLDLPEAFFDALRAIFRLLARPPRWLHVEDVQDLRESTEEFSVVLSDVAGLIERVRLLQEEIASRLEEQNNRTLFTLTLVTVLAMPINIIAGFFGMNVGGIPLVENKHGFWVMVLLVAGSTGLTGWWAFSRRRER